MRFWVWGWVLAVAGCGATVVPPRAVRVPTTVYICDYGVHSSVLLPVDGGGRFVEYLYGDWNWAALDHTHWYDAIGAVFFSQQATLGRRYLTAAGGGRPLPYPPPKTQSGLMVDGDSCREVVRQLDARWESHKSTAYVPTEGGGYFLFVKDDQKYSWLHDCNHHTADCLRAMGCQIKGSAMWSGFTIERP